MSRLAAFAALVQVSLLPACAGVSESYGPPILPEPVVTQTEVVPAEPALAMLRIELVSRQQDDAAAREAALSDTALGAMSAAEPIDTDAGDGRTPQQVAHENGEWLAGQLAEHGRPTLAQVREEGMNAFAGLCLRTLHDVELAGVCVDALDDAAAAGELSDEAADRMQERACARFGARLDACN